MASLPLDRILSGDCRTILEGLPAESVDLVFADPPYNLQLRGELYRPDHSRVDAVDNSWDQFENFAAYDSFTRGWLEACRRVLKPTGTLWVIGSYHNIHRVGKILMDVGYWILNDVVWVKTNPMPQFRGVRFTNAHETLIWVKKSVDQKRYTFHYHVMKALNGGKQMRSDWVIPLCTGSQRLKINGEKAHTTQKPEALLERVIRACSSRGDVVLDPFFGTGTTGAVSKRYGRHYIGIETDSDYIKMATERIAGVQPALPDDLESSFEQGRPTRIPFVTLIANGMLQPGQDLRFAGTHRTARIDPDGSLNFEGVVGSIHKIGTIVADTPSCNGWEHWLYRDTATGEERLIDCLRQEIRRSTA